MMSALTLSDLDKATGGSIIRSLFGREIGNHDKTMHRIDAVVHRQLIKGRGKKTKTSEQAQAEDKSLRKRNSSKSRRQPKTDKNAPPLTTFTMSPFKPTGANGRESGRSGIILRRNLPRPSPSTSTSCPRGRRAPPGIVYEAMLKTQPHPCQVALLDDYIFLRRSKPDQPYYCYSSYSLAKLTGDPQHLYAIPSRGRWISWEMFYPSMNNPNSSIYTQRFVPAILVLRRHSPYLFVYNLSNGRKLHELYLDPKIKYTQLNRCWFDNSGFVIQSDKASLPKDVALDFIVIDYPPLHVSARCQIEKKAFPGSNGVEVSGYFLYATYPTFIELCDLKSVLNEEFLVPIDGGASSAEVPEGGVNGIALHERKRIRITHVVDAKLPVLVKIENCFMAYLEMSAYGTPPYYIKKGKEKTLQVYNTNDDQAGNSELLRFTESSQPDDDGLSLTFHPDQTSRLILSAENRIRVLKLKWIDEETGERTLETEFDTYELTTFMISKRKLQEPSSSNDHNQQESIQTTSAATRRNPRRQSASEVSYIEVDAPEIGLKWDWFEPSNVFAILEMSEKLLRFHLFDNENWTLLTILESHNFCYTPTKGKVFFPAKTTFNMASSHISVQEHENGKDTQKMYLLNYLAELSANKQKRKRKRVKTMS